VRSYICLAKKISALAWSRIYSLLQIPLRDL
jgi:hypothetical protein